MDLFLVHSGFCAINYMANVFFLRLYSVTECVLSKVNASVYIGC